MGSINHVQFLFKCFNSSLRIKWNTFWPWKKLINFRFLICLLYVASVYTQCTNKRVFSLFQFSMKDLKKKCDFLWFDVSDIIKPTTRTVVPYEVNQKGKRFSSGCMTHLTMTKSDPLTRGIPLGQRSWLFMKLTSVSSYGWYSHSILFESKPLGPKILTNLLLSWIANMTFQITEVF